MWIQTFFGHRPQSALHWVTLAVHLGFVLTVVLRPYLPYIVGSFNAFDDVLPWKVWGWVAGTIALSLLLVKPGTGWSQTAHLFSSAYFFLVASVFVTGSGLTTSYFTYSSLAIGSLWLLLRDFRDWFPRQQWVKRLVDHPPAWIKRREG
ncbi:hypothetical protein BOO71_0000382 [Deinococcus marmoris]|uniref:Uncharacterized protein n=2 Tax=Deinococcus marmoris TaxID=249408 RepID=A0A1U7P4N8_9DEIO|nr:hypothetical protein BOO71_0000382 [Deinococcus marmoris]